MAAVDLRSDTLTLPTDAMRRAMAEAPLGDDVHGEDPTVNRLQERAAQVLGTEAALMVASGTMGNLLGILVSARAGQEIIADADSHVFLYEGGGPAALGGIQVRPLATARGWLEADQVARAIRPVDDHQPASAALCIEDTHNRHGGTVWPLDQLRAVTTLARERGLRVHLDGARVFNAAVAQGVDVKEIAACADTVTFCISKGLGAPVGSILCGTREQVDAARRWRKMLGGGWRQAGMLAAAGLVALDTMIDRLADDHANARTLAEGLAEMPGIDIDLTRVETNIVLFRPTRMSAESFIGACAGRGLLGGNMGQGQVRFVTRYDVGAGDIGVALGILSDVLAEA